MKDYYNYFNAYGPYWGTAASAAGLFYNSWKSSRAPYNATDWKLPKSNITGPPGNTTGEPWNPDKSRRSPAVRVRLRFKGGGSRTITEEEDPSNSNNNMIGSRLKRSRMVKAGRKKFKLMKLISSNLNWTEQHLGLGTRKHLVSEYDPGTGGCVSIPKFLQATGTSYTPMHVYDLNLYVAGVADTSGNYPTNANGINADINARMWIWSANNSFVLPTGASQPRWYINDPLTANQDSFAGTKTYRKGICIDFMLYGCRKTYTEYDVRVIKILDPKYCPDYDQTLVDDTTSPNNTPLKDVKQAWQSLVYPYTVNPMLKGIEPGPKIPKRWFKTVAKKFVRIGEQSGDAEQVPSVKSRIYVNCNEVNNMSWDQKGFTLQEGGAFYDNAPTIEAADTTENLTSHSKPHYRARYYLVIRALSPQDVASGALGGQDGSYDLGGTGAVSNFNFQGQTDIDYVPTYDLAIRTTYATLNGQV